MVQTYRLVTDHPVGVGAETEEFDLPTDSSQIIKSLIFDLIAQQKGGAAPTKEAVAKQLDEIKFGVRESPEISEILGEDLLNSNILMGNRPISDLGGADNTRISLGMVLPLDPFMMSPQIDYRQPYGLPGKIAGKLSVKFGADPATLDTKKLTVGIITSKISDVVSSLASLQGYLTYHKHQEVLAVGSAKSFSIPQPGKLLGVHFFETTSYADVVDDGAGRAQTIKEVSITRGEKVIQGPIPTTTPAIMNGQDVTELTDQGHSFWNFGIHNKIGQLGVPTKGRIPDDMKVKVLGGVADEARIYPITLNDNLG